MRYGGIVIYHGVEKRRGRGGGNWWSALHPGYIKDQIGVVICYINLTTGADFTISVR